MKYTTPSLLCAIIGISLIGAPGARAEVIYANDTTRINDTQNLFNPGTLEIGDELNVAGTARYVTKFAFEYYGKSLTPDEFAGSVSFRVRFYNNTGALVSGYPAPNDTFFDSGWISEAGGDILRPTSGGTFIFTPGDGLPDEGLFLPDSKFTFSVQFKGMLGGDELGVALYDPPTVGSSQDDYWQKTSTWALRQNVIGPMNFGTLIEASLVPVPEPTVLGLLAVGGVVVLMRRRQS